MDGFKLLTQVVMKLEKVFDTPGEYRVLTTTITGGMCSLGESGTSLKVNFGDENYIGQSCFPAPA